MAETNEEKTGTPIPPKLDLKKAGILNNGQPAESAAGAPEQKKPILTIKPETGGAAAPTSEARPAAKKETARIPLEAAKPPLTIVPPAGEPKTIRIKPATTPSALRVGGDQTSAAAEGKTAEQLSAAKRTTSRISLEAVLGTPGEGGKPAEGAPKTIRLRRPGETAGVRPIPAPGVPGQAEGVAAEGEGAPTVRKTIRVRRAVETPEIARPTIARAETLTPAGLESLAPEEKVSVVFPLIALAAILVTCVLIYMFLGQAVGPDLSLTQLSMGARGLDLPWPGKIPVRLQ